MKSLYALLMEKISRDIAISTAVGVTAGMRAAIGDTQHGQSIESRVEQELDAVFREIMNSPSIAAPTVQSLVADAASPSVAPKRGPGRPRKAPFPEGSS